jgi:hypothetical protein
MSSHERRRDLETRDRVSEIHSHYVKITRRLFWINSLLAIGILISLAFAAWFIAQNRYRAQEIQDQRAEFILRDCLDRNARHLKTIKGLDRSLSVMVVTPTLYQEQIDELRGSRDFIAGLVKALVPFKNCEALVEQYT